MSGAIISVSVHRINIEPGNQFLWKPLWI